jgi:hypothetical protein
VVTSFSSKKGLKSTYRLRRGLFHNRGALPTAPFKQKKVGTIDISFMEYSTTSKSVCLTPDIVEYEVGAPSPFNDLIIGKQTLHDIGVVLDFKEKTITIDYILLPIRNIVNMQLKPSVTKALQHNTVQAQEPVSTQNTTKRVIEIQTPNMTKQIFQK